MGGKLEGDFGSKPEGDAGSKLDALFTVSGSKLEGDGDHFEWALTEDIDQAILNLPSMTVSIGGVKLTGKLEQ